MRQLQYHWANDSNWKEWGKIIPFPSLFFGYRRPQGGVLWVIWNFSGKLFHIACSFSLDVQSTSSSLLSSSSVIDPEAVDV